MLVLLIFLGANYGIDKTPSLGSLTLFLFLRIIIVASTHIQHFSIDLRLKVRLVFCLHLDTCPLNYNWRYLTIIY